METFFFTKNSISQEKEQHLNTSPIHQVSCDDNIQTLTTSCKEKPLVPSWPTNEGSLLKNMTDQQNKFLEDESNADKMKKQHWKESIVCDRVVIPERWEQEAFLKDWIDYSSFDALLAPKGVAKARESLVAEARARSKGMNQIVV